MNTRYLCLLLSILFILLAIFLPPMAVIEALRINPPAGQLEQLLAGAKWFKAALLGLGIWTLFLAGRFSAKLDSHASKPSSELSGHLIFLSLLAIFVVGLALRLYKLDSGLWFDEITTYLKFASMPVGELVSTYDTQNQNFLYSLFVRACFVLFGEGAWSLRLPAVIFGVGSLWAMYYFARRLVSPREALLTAALLTFSYHHIWFSQNARGYTGLLFWTLLASGLFLQALREGRPGLWLAYAASAALGVYTQMTMVFVIVSHFTAYATTLCARRKETWPDRWSGFFFGFGLAGLFILLLHALVLPQILSIVVGQESTVPAWKNPLWTIVELFQGVSVGFVHGGGAIIALAVFSVGLWSFGRSNGTFLQLLFIPPLLCAVVNIAMGHHLWPRFFFFTFGFAALVVVHGTMLLGHWMTRYLKFTPANSAAFGTILCAGLIVVSAWSARLAFAPKQDYQGALDFVSSGTQPGDVVVTSGLATFPYQNLYKVNWQSVESIEVLNAVRAKAKRTWLLYTFPTHMTAVYPDIMTAVQRDFEIVKRFPGTVGDGAIFVYRSNGPVS